MCDVIIVGGGASGMFAAAELLSAGLSVMIFEPNRFLGRKLRITGKGRCNLTNNCPPEEVMKNIPRNPKFLYSALQKFPPEKIMSWFEAAGVPLKTERGRRVFPESDSAHDIADALAKKCSGAEIVHEKVTGIILADGRAAGVRTSSGEYFSRQVILATGGLSYPLTGSDGSGYKIARDVGHTVEKCRPSLVPIAIDKDLPQIDLKNVSLRLVDINKPKKILWQEQGELTLGGSEITGPLALTASCVMDEDMLKCKGYRLYIDFKPALSSEKLDLRILREIKETPGENLTYLLKQLLPSALTDTFSDQLNAEKSQILGNMPKALRISLIDLLKSFPLTPIAFKDYGEAIITRGGINVKEINPGSMESKLVKDLYFTGEIIDVDGFTGGYNLTIAFSTAFTAAEDIIRKKKEKDQ